MGLFHIRSKEEKRQKSIRELEELIAAYDNPDAPAWQRTYDIHITAIERLEKLIGTENLSGDNVETLIYHYDRKKDAESIDRLLPAYSRHFAKRWIEPMAVYGYDYSPYYLCTYLIGGEYDWKLSVVVRPDLEVAMEYAGHLEDPFYQELVGQLKDAGYPGDTKDWGSRLGWMADRTDNPGVKYLYEKMLECTAGSETF